MTSAYSLSFNVTASPVDPHTTIPLIPPASWRLSNRLNAGKSTAPLFVNGVTMAVNAPCRIILVILFYSVRFHHVVKRIQSFFPVDEFRGENRALCETLSPVCGVRDGDSVSGAVKNHLVKSGIHAAAR